MGLAEDIKNFTELVPGIVEVINSFGPKVNDDDLQKAQKKLEQAELSVEKIEKCIRLIRASADTAQYVATIAGEVMDIIEQALISYSESQFPHKTWKDLNEKVTHIKSDISNASVENLKLLGKLEQSAGEAEKFFHAASILDAEANFDSRNSEIRSLREAMSNIHSYEETLLVELIESLENIK